MACADKRDTGPIYLTSCKTYRGMIQVKAEGTGVWALASTALGARDTGPIYSTPYKTYRGMIQVKAEGTGVWALASTAWAQGILGQYI